MAAFHEQSVDDGLDTPPNHKRETFQEVTIGMNCLIWTSTAGEYKVVVRASGKGVPALNLSAEVCALSWARLKHIQMGVTAHWGQQQKVDPHPFLPFFFFIKFLLFDLFILPYTEPLDIESILGQQETVVPKKKKIKLHLYVFILARFHNTWLLGWLFVCYIHLRAVDGVTQRLCFPFAPTSCLPKSPPPPQSRWDHL